MTVRDRNGRFISKEEREQRDARQMELEETVEVQGDKIQRLERQLEYARRGLLLVLDSASMQTAEWKHARHALQEMWKNDLYAEARMEGLKWKMSHFKFPKKV